MRRWVVNAQPTMPPGVHVDDQGEVGEPGPGAHVGQVAHPQLVRPGGAELPLHQVRRPGRDARRRWWCAWAGRGAPRPGRAWRISRASRSRPMVDAVAAQRRPHLAHPVDAVVGLVHGRDLLGQDRVGDRAGRRRPGLGGVVAGHRQEPGIGAGQHTDQRLDPETIPDVRRRTGSSRPGAVELRGEKRAGRLQNLVGPAQLRVLPPQPLHLGRLITGRARPLPGVDLRPGGSTCAASRCSRRACTPPT